ncbi:MAG TPA: hypothetical protein VE988_27610 [Gemmataceae bacterium]|nr:hypothetical protein [Gemmataceae bacterium]
MRKYEFESPLRKYLERRPFQPFIVVWADGRQIVVKQPSVAFSDGGAGFIDPNDDALVDFSRDQVLAFGTHVQGASV